MKRRYLFAAFLSCSLSVSAVEISVGATPIFVPAPRGYAQVTSEMTPYADLAKRFVAPTNVEFALFIPEPMATRAAKGEIPDNDRRFSVQAAASLVGRFISTAEFKELKRTIRTQNEEAVKKAQAEIGAHFENLKKGLAKDYSANVDLALTQMTPLPPHYESEHALAYSMHLKYAMTDDKGRPTPFEGTVTTTFTHVKGRVLFLYTYGGNKDLAWSQSSSQAWVEALVAANPSDPIALKRESTQSSRSLDWGRIAGKALVGALVAGVVALVGQLWKQKKRADS